MFIIISQGIKPFEFFLSLFYMPCYDFPFMNVCSNVVVNQQQDQWTIMFNDKSKLFVFFLFLKKKYEQISAIYHFKEKQTEAEQWRCHPQCSYFYWIQKLKVEK